MIVPLEVDKAGGRGTIRGQESVVGCVTVCACDSRRGRGRNIHAQSQFLWKLLSSAQNVWTN